MSHKVLQERDCYIDLVRGLCAVSVVFIHSVFWSGSSYVPNYMRNISLFFDVPVFFFLAGATINILGGREVKDLAIKQISKLIFYFFALVLSFQILFWNFDIQRLIQPLVLSRAHVPELRVISGSYWFVPTYCISILFAQIIYHQYPRIIYPLFLLGGGYFFSQYFLNFHLKVSVLGQPFQNILFYVILVLLGYRFYSLKFKRVVWLLSSIAFGLIFYYLFWKSNVAFSSYSLQKFKFPVQLPYVCVSLAVICLILAFKTRIVASNCLTRLITFLGRNAIFFYMSQGVSSSLIYKLIPVINLNWEFKLIILFAINCLLAMIIGYIFYYIDNLFSPFVRKLLFRP